MKNNHQLSSRLLRYSPLPLALAIAVWAATGARWGWTQTSRVVMQQDAVTGIDYPVREAAFSAGVEVLAAGFGGAALLVAAGLLLRRREARSSL